MTDLNETYVARPYSSVLSADERKQLAGRLQQIADALKMPLLQFYELDLLRTGAAPMRSSTDGDAFHHFGHDTGHDTGEDEGL